MPRVEKPCHALVAVDFPQIISSRSREKESINRHCMSVAVWHTQNQGTMIKCQRLSDFDKSSIFWVFRVSICNWHTVSIDSFFSPWTTINNLRKLDAHCASVKPLSLPFSLYDHFMNYGLDCTVYALQYQKWHQLGRTIRMNIRSLFKTFDSLVRDDETRNGSV
jgi:hypothetical protein